MLSRLCGYFRTRKRPGWDEYFLGIAAAVSVRGDCHRSRVGAVLVGPDRRIRATGYNGTSPGGLSCLAGDCDRCNSDQPSGTGYENCIETHAEQNCVEFADKPDRVGATLYITRAPCHMCEALIKRERIGRVVYPGHFGLLDYKL
ncbi:deoxycytidylate deaminase [Streptomyces rosealbus]